jgi:hypothetical protein
MKLRKISFFPNDLQELLLKACLGEADIALPSWEKWKAEADIDHLDNDSFNLIPLLYSNLSKWSVNDPLMPTFKGIYRRSWYLNKILFNQTAELISELSRNNIETVLLKGAAWSHQYYHDTGARHMEDVDLLVPYEKINEALSLLKSLGYNISGNYYFKSPPEGYFVYNKELGFLNQKKHRLDLHWFAMSGSLYKEVDNDLWSRSVRYDFYGSNTRVLCTLDAILHSFLHAAFISYAPPIRWVADSCTIMRSLSGDEDWDVFVTEVHRRHAGYPVSEMLLYLKDRFSEDVPDALISRIDQLQFSRFEKFYFSIGRKGYVLPEEPFTMVLLVRLTGYLFFSKSSGKGMFSLLNILSFLDYFKFKNGLISRFQVIRWLVSRLTSRMLG